jgi:ATP-dependent DNA helicase RecG
VDASCAGDKPVITTLPLQFIKGIGPKRAEVLAAEGVVTPLDVIMNVPRAYIDRQAAPSIRAVIATSTRLKGANEEAEFPHVQHEISIIAQVIGVQKRNVGRGKGRTMLSVAIADGSGSTAELVYWNFVEYYAKALKEGMTIVVSGKPEFSHIYGTLQFHHPEIERVDEDDLATYRAGGILPKYAMTQAMRTAGISMKTLRELARSVLEIHGSGITDPLPDSIRRSLHLVERHTALHELHNPQSIPNLDAARARMKFEELFFFQLLVSVRGQSKKTPDLGIVMNPRSSRARALVEALPYQLTAAQRRVIHEIVNDMQSGLPMNRLLQGDVGSGKTIVALLCLLNVIDNGYQTVLMAPTEILAEQHFHSISALVQNLDVHVVQLVGGQRKSIRTKVAEDIASGKANIVVGTHAVFEADVSYHRLGCVVIDEQHRFGVAQRASLLDMARSSHDGQPRSPHVLVMSATPIPRTLSMTAYGDLDNSVIDELPANRLPIQTHIVFESGLAAVHDFIRSQVQAGRQAYIVYPLVEVSDKVDLKSAVEHHEQLQSEVFPSLRVGLLHGQMLWYEKEDAMRAFLNRDYDILVATTVVEVGIDVPNATVMLIENAERFGLTQLHQLRGRVGRSNMQSHCFLATKDHFKYKVGGKGGIDDAVAAVTRLKTMAATTDGFRIAQVDLELRGPGDVLGTRQSGLPEFRFADISRDVETITVARAQAQALLKADPGLNQREHALAKHHLLELYQEASKWMAIA